MKYIIRMTGGWNSSFSNCAKYFHDKGGQFIGEKYPGGKGKGGSEKEQGRTDQRDTLKSDVLGNENFYRVSLVHVFIP